MLGVEVWENSDIVGGVYKIYSPNLHIFYALYVKSSDQSNRFHITENVVNIKNISFPLAVQKKVTLVKKNPALETHRKDFNRGKSDFG